MLASLISFQSDFAARVRSLSHRVSEFQSRHLRSLLAAKTKLEPIQKSVLIIRGMIADALKASVGGKAGKGSKLFVVLSPLQQLMSEIGNRCEALDDELTTGEIVCGGSLGNKLQAEGEEVAGTRTETGAKSQSRRDLEGTASEAGSSSCSVTDLEDFAYRLLHHSTQVSSHSPY